jgi:FHS family L-fucose permease-like MFS transporter
MALSMPPPTTASPSARSGGMFTTADGRNHVFTFALVCTLFLLWGFTNGMLDVLNKQFQNALGLSKFESGFVQSANFIAYFLMALPAGFLAKRYGYKGGIVIGLSLVACGAFWFMPATKIGTYGAFLTGIFILASGVTCLETIANPYSTVLGPPEMAAARINMAQTLNGVGLVLGPMGGDFFLSSTHEVNRSNANVYIPYAGVGLLAVVLIVLFIVSKVPDVQAEEEAKTERSGVSTVPLWRRPHFVFGVVSQVLYVGVQSAIFGFFINYIIAEMPTLGYHPTDSDARKLLQLAFLLFLAGRFTGTIVLRFFRASNVLGTYALIGTVLSLLVMRPLGWVSVVSLFGTFFLMSIMFPTIFSLGIHGVGEHTKRASSFIVMAIVGGAVTPPLMGKLADVFNMRTSFLVPFLCFAGIAAYGITWQKRPDRARAGRRSRCASRPRSPGRRPCKRRWGGGRGRASGRPRARVDRS